MGTCFSGRLSNAPSEKRHVPSEWPVRRTFEVLYLLSAFCTAARTSDADLCRKSIHLAKRNESRWTLPRVRVGEALVDLDRRIKPREQRRVQVHDFDIGVGENRDTSKLRSVHTDLC